MLQSSFCHHIYFIWTFIHETISYVKSFFFFILITATVDLKNSVSFFFFFTRIVFVVGTYNVHDHLNFNNNKNELNDSIDVGLLIYITSNLIGSNLGPQISLRFFVDIFCYFKKRFRINLSLFYNYFCLLRRVKKWPIIEIIRSTKTRFLLGMLYEQRFFFSNREQEQNKIFIEKKRNIWLSHFPLSLFNGLFILAQNLFFLSGFCSEQNSNSVFAR